MPKRRLDQVDGTERDIYGEGWRSRRLVVAEDGTPYSFHITVLDRGVRLSFEYARHRETVCCIVGKGTINDLATGETLTLASGGALTGRDRRAPRDSRAERDDPGVRHWRAQKKQTEVPQPPSGP